MRVGAHELAHLGPLPRTPEQIMVSRSRQAAPAPKAEGKWLTASITDSAAQVIAEVFNEAARRDPRRERPWLVLVAGNNHQIDRVRAEAAERGVAGHFVLVFLSVALWWGLPIGKAWSAVVVAVVWGVVAAVLALRGRAELRRVRGAPRTAETVRKIPNALKGDEEANHE